MVGISELDVSGKNLQVFTEHFAQQAAPGNETSAMNRKMKTFRALLFVTRENFRISFEFFRAGIERGAPDMDLASEKLRGHVSFGPLEFQVLCFGFLHNEVLPD
jgi:hypothetical protein